MFNSKIKNLIKQLGKDKENQDFLITLKKDLKDYMDFYPAVRKEADERLLLLERSKFINLNILKTKYMPAIIIALVVLLGGGGGVTLASQNSLPGEALYPVKAFTEKTRLALAASPEEKVQLGNKLAKERLEEIQELLKEKNKNPKGLGIAISRLEDHLSLVSTVVDKEKKKGKDIKELKKESDEGLVEVEDELNEASKIEEAEAKDEIKKLKEKIKAIKSERKGEGSEFKDKNGESVEKKLENKAEAIKAIDEAKKKLDEVKAELSKENIVLAATAFDKYNDFIKKTEEALTKESYVQARQHAKQAITSLEQVKKQAEKDKQEKEDAEDEEEDEDQD